MGAYNVHVRSYYAQIRCFRTRASVAWEASGPRDCFGIGVTAGGRGNKFGAFGSGRRKPISYNASGYDLARQHPANTECAAWSCAAGRGVSAIAASLLPLIADTGDGHMDWDGGWWIVMALGMLVFWGLVILGVVWLVREFARAREQRPAATEPDPFAILDRRLASGEISPEEYRERRDVLGRGSD